MDFVPHHCPIRLVVSDVDGVMNTGILHFAADGQELFKDFHVQDGYGIKMLLQSGLYFAVITGRSSPILRNRLGPLGVDRIYEGVGDKLPVLMMILSELNVVANEVAYIGDDLNDLGILAYLYENQGVGFCPPQAVPLVAETAQHTTVRGSGQGCLREVIDWVLWQNCQHA